MLFLRTEQQEQAKLLRVQFCIIWADNAHPDDSEFCLHFSHRADISGYDSTFSFYTRIDTWLP